MVLKQEPHLTLEVIVALPLLLPDQHRPAAQPGRHGLVSLVATFQEPNPDGRTTPPDPIEQPVQAGFGLAQIALNNEPTSECEHHVCKVAKLISAQQLTGDLQCQLLVSVPLHPLCT